MRLPTAIRTVTWAVALLLVASLAGLATAGPVAANQAVSGTVTFWNGYSPIETDTLTKQVIPAFEKQYPNVKVKAQTIPYDSLRQKLLTGIAGGQVPDVLRSDIIWVPEFADLGALEPLDTAMSNFTTLKDQVYPGTLETNFYQGHYYGLPLDTNTRILFYNKSLFKEAGIAAAPKSFEDFQSACQKIKALGKKGVYCYAEGGTGAWNIMPWVWSNGGAITNPDYTKATGFLNSAASVQAVTMLRDMEKDGTLSPSILGGGLGTSDALGKNQAAMIIDGPWMPGILKASYPNLDYGMALMPAGPGGSISVVGGEDIVLFKASKNKEAAKAFITFMLSTEAQTMMGKVGQMPVLKSLAGSSAMPDYFATFQEQLKTAKPRTPSPAWPKIDDAINTTVQNIVRGKEEPQAGLDKAAGTIDGLLAGKK